MRWWEQVWARMARTNHLERAFILSSIAEQITFSEHVDDPLDALFSDCVWAMVCLVQSGALDSDYLCSGGFCHSAARAAVALQSNRLASAVVTCNADHACSVLPYCLRVCVKYKPFSLGKRCELVSQLFRRDKITVSLAASLVSSRRKICHNKGEYPSYFTALSRYEPNA